MAFFGKNVVDMQTYVLLRGLKQIGHLVLRQPDGVLVHSHFETSSAVFGLIKNQLRRGWRFHRIRVSMEKHGRMMLFQFQGFLLFLQSFHL